jgi:hypothetical protein
MKLPVFVAALVGAVAANAQAANYPSDMPSCGATCGNNMFGKATSSEIGCQSSTDYNCLCNKPNFLYGVRDCSYQYCQNNTAANIAIAWGNSFCSKFSGTITVSTETGTYSGNGTASAASTPTATATTTETITSGSATFVTTVSGTLYGPVVTTITTPIVSTVTGGGTSFTTTLGTSTITTENFSGASYTATSSSSTSSTTSSSAGAAHMTAGPVVGLLAAGLAAAALL